MASLRSVANARSSGTPVRVQGTVTFIEPDRKLLVLQDGSDVQPFYTDLPLGEVSPGDQIELEGAIGTLITALPRYSQNPDGREIRRMFEAPTDWNESFLSRLRGLLHPPTTGDYTFWIASDDSSELWLSDGEDAGKARRIALVEAGRWTEPRQWTRFASQRSRRIRLEAGKAYYIEALGQDAYGRDCLAVAWQGPDFERTVIDGKFVSPWSPRGGPQESTNQGVIWEYWLNFHSSDLSVLRSSDPNLLKLDAVRLLKKQRGQMPEPLPVSLGHPIEAQADFRWVELEGCIEFLSEVDDGWLMELTGGRSRVTARIQSEHKPNLVLPIGSVVRVTGFFEPTSSPNPELHSGKLWVNGGGAVVWLDSEENWSLIEEMPQQRLTATNAELSVGRLVRTQGRVVAQEGPDLWRLEGKDVVQGYISADGTNWSPAGAAIELHLSNQVLVGFAISSHRTGELAIVDYEDVSGLSSSFAGADIGDPPLPGGWDELSGSHRVQGSGDDIWLQSDQCFFAYQVRQADFQIDARLGEYRANDPGAKTVLMVRESLASDSPWAGLAVMPGYRAGVQGRPETGANAVGALTSLSESNRLLRLVRQRNSFLIGAASDSLPAGQLVEVLGEVGWQGQELVVRRPRIRKLPATPEGISAVPPSEQSVGDLRDVSIGDLAAEARNARKMARLLIVKLRGVVTFNDQVGNDWYSYLQDQSGSVRIQWRNRTLQEAVKVGDWVEVTGTPTLTESGVELAAQGVSRLGGSEMPVALRFQPEATAAALQDGLWTELEGVGWSSAAEDRLLLMARMGEIEISTGSTPPAHFTNWVNARVRVRGVLLRRPSQKLLLPSERYVQIMEAPPEDPFGIPVFPVRTLQTRTSEPRPARMLKITGTVTCRRNDWIAVQDKTGGIRVESKAASSVKVGEEIEVVGFPTERGVGVVLSDSLLRPILQVQSVAPTVLAPDSLAHIESNGALVSVEAILLAQHAGGDVQTLDVQSGQRAYQASLPVADGHLPVLAVGSRLRLTGVVVVDGAGASTSVMAASSGLMGSLELLLRGPGDVVVLERPPWWNWKHTAATGGLVVAVFAGAVMWIRTLRKRVEERTRELRETMGKLQRETRISATLAERDRLAAEIHDSVEQGLSAIMMQMEAATMADDPQDVKRYLTMAMNMAGFSRSEVQHAVWDMQSPLLENADLPTALRRVAHDIGAGDHPRVTVELSGTTFPLPSAVEHHLLRIAQEAMTNAVKHGAPQTIVLALHYSSDAMTLTVRDDGSGFVPETASTQAGHFGLQGMRTRAAKIRAGLILSSKPGEGTSVQITIPRGNRAAVGEPAHVKGH